MNNNYIGHFINKVNAPRRRPATTETAATAASAGKRSKSALSAAVLPAMALPVR